MKAYGRIGTSSELQRRVYDIICDHAAGLDAASGNFSRMLSM